VTRCRRNRSVRSLRLWSSRSPVRIPAQQPVARLEGRTYDSDVVGKSGAGMERSTAIVVFPSLAGARGDAERAGELLDQALATARGLGLANIERRAVALLQ